MCLKYRKYVEATIKMYVAKADTEEKLEKFHDYVTSITFQFLDFIQEM